MARPLTYALIARWAVAERSDQAAALFAEGFAGVRELGLTDADFPGLAHRVIDRWQDSAPDRADEARQLLAHLG